MQTITIAGRGAAVPSITTSVPRGHPTLSLIQAFRGIAALIVVLFHFGERSSQLLGRDISFGLFEMGKSGVDFFFVLSGFIICFIHSSDLGRSSRFRAYALKRLIRIYPLYLLVTLFALPIYLSGYGVAAKRNTATILKSFLLLPQAPHTYPIVNIGWTLSHEVFFYAIFGFAILVGLRWAIPLFAIVLGGSIGHLLFAAPPADSAWAALVFSKFNLEFAAGCAIAYLVTHKPPRNSTAVAMLVIGLGAFSLLGCLLCSLVVKLQSAFRCAIRSDRVWRRRA